MAKKVRIDTTLNIGLTSTVNIEGDTFSVVTEKVGRTEVYFVSNVYNKGQSVFNRKFESDTELDPMDTVRLDAAMRKHHWEVVTMVEEGRCSEGRKAPDYVEEVKALLRKKSSRKALDLLKEAYNLYPDDPFILSYYGCLLAVIDKNHAEGIAACRKALDVLPIRMPISMGANFKAMLYLNLARSYMAADKKKLAVDALDKGARFDTDEGLINKELIKLGVRRKPPISFLKRSNPINKYVGKMLYSSGKQ